MWIQPELVQLVAPTRPEAWRTSCCCSLLPARRDLTRLSHTRARAHRRVHAGRWKVPSVRRQLSGFAGTGGCCRGRKESELMK